jgi:hypothetical protein
VQVSPELRAARKPADKRKVASAIDENSIRWRGIRRRGGRGIRQSVVRPAGGPRGSAAITVCFGSTRYVDEAIAKTRLA